MTGEDWHQIFRDTMVRCGGGGEVWRGWRGGGEGWRGGGEGRMGSGGE